MRRLEIYLLVIIFLLTVNGCGTYVSRQIDYYGYYFGPLRASMYSGVVWDFENQGASHGQPFSYFLFIDLPLSFAADTLILPLTVYERFGLSDLPQAAYKGETQQIKELLAKGVDINGTDWQGHTALMGAVKGAHVDLVRMLLAENAAVNMRSNFGKTALSYGRHYIEYSDRDRKDKQYAEDRMNIIRFLLQEAGGTE